MKSNFTPLPSQMGSADHSAGKDKLKAKTLVFVIASAFLAMMTSACSGFHSDNTSYFGPVNSGSSADVLVAPEHVLEYEGVSVNASNVTCSGTCPENVVINNKDHQPADIKNTYKTWAEAVAAQEKSGNTARSAGDASDVASLIYTDDILINDKDSNFDNFYLSLEKPDDVSIKLPPVVFTGNILAKGDNPYVKVVDSQSVAFIGSAIQPSVNVEENAEFYVTGAAIDQFYNQGMLVILPPVKADQKISAEHPFSYYAQYKEAKFTQVVDGITYQYNEVGLELGSNLYLKPMSILSLKAGNNPVSVNVEGDDGVTLEGYLLVPTIVPQYGVKQIAMMVNHPRPDEATQIGGNFRNVVSAFDKEHQYLPYLGVMLPPPSIVDLTINGTRLDAVVYPLFDYHVSPMTSVGDFDFTAPVFAAGCGGCDVISFNVIPISVEELQKRLTTIQNQVANNSSDDEDDEDEADDSDNSDAGARAFPVHVVARVHERDKASSNDDEDVDNSNADDDSDSDVNNDDSDASSSQDDSSDEDSGCLGDTGDTDSPPVFCSQQGGITGSGNVTYSGPGDTTKQVVPVFFADDGYSTATGTFTMDKKAVVGVYGTVLNMDMVVNNSTFYLSGGVKSIMNNANSSVQVFNGDSAQIDSAYSYWTTHDQPDQSKIPVQLIMNGISDNSISEVVAYPVGGVLEGDYTQDKTASLSLIDGFLAVKGTATLAGSLYVSYAVLDKSYYSLAILSNHTIKGKFDTVKFYWDGKGTPSQAGTQKVVQLSDAKGGTYYALVIKMPTVTDFAGSHADAQPTSRAMRVASGNNRTQVVVASAKSVDANLNALKKSVANAEHQVLTGHFDQGNAVQFSTRKASALSRLVSLMEAPVVSSDPLSVAAQELKQLIDGSAFSRMNDMNANMQAFVASQGQAALLQPLQQKVQVRLDTGLFFGSKAHKANLQQVSVLGNVGPVRARVAVNRMGNTFTFKADDLYQGAAAGLETQSQMYGVNAGAVYDVPGQGFSVGAQLGYEYVSNTVQKGQVAKLLPKASEDLSYQQHVVQLDLLASKAFEWNVEGMGVRVTPFAGYRYGYEHQAAYQQQFDVVMPGQGKVAVNLNVPELNRNRNSLVAGVQGFVANAFAVKGLTLGASLSGQFRFDSDKAVNSEVRFALNKDSKAAQATFRYKDESRVNLQGHVEASYQLQRVQLGASLDALYHASGEPVLFQLGVKAAVNF